MAREYAGSLMFNTKIDSDGFNRDAKKVSGFGGKLTGQLVKFAKRGAIAMGSAITAAMVSGVKYNAQMEQYFQSFKTMLGNTQEATKHMQMLKKFAAETPFEMTDLAQASQTLLAFGEDVNLIEGDLKMLGDISLGNREKFSALALVFGQVKSQGRLMGQDLLQMINAGFNPLRVISQKTGKSVTELKDEMAKGKITFEMVADAMKTATSAGGQFNDAMKAQSKTMVGLWSTLKDNVHAKLGEATQEVSNIIKQDLLPNAIAFVEKFNVKKTVAGVKTLITVLKVASPLVAGLYAAPRLSGGVSTLSALWSRGMIEAKKYKIEMAAIARLSLAGTKAEISGVGLAVGLMTKQISLAEAKTLALGKAQAAVASINPYVAITVGVLAFMSAIYVANEAMKKHAIEADKDYSAVLNLAKANKEAEKAYNQQKKAAEEDMIQKGAEVENAISLKRELDGIVDANGRVKKGYEDRAAAIVSILQAQGVEIEMHNGLIQNYSTLSGEIDKYLEKKRAEIVLSAHEESYQIAQKNIRKSTEEYAKASRELEKHTKSQSELNRMSAGELAEYTEKHRRLTKTRNESLAQTKKYTEDIKLYEKLLTETTKGNYGQIDAILNNHAKTMAEINKKSKKELKKQREDTASELKMLNQLYKTTGSEYVKSAAKAKQEELKAIDAKLGEQNKTIKKNKGKVKEATKEMMSGAKEGIDETELTMDPKLEQLSNSPKAYGGVLQQAMGKLIGDASAVAGSANLKGPFGSKLTQLSNSPHGYRGTIASAMRALMNAGKSGASSVSYYDVGYAAGTGIQRGLAAAATALYRAAKNIADNTIRVMKNAIESNSPSKKAAREVGAPIPEGVEVGVLKKAKNLYKTLRGVSANMISAITPKNPVTVGIGVAMSSTGLSLPRLAQGTRIPMQAEAVFRLQSEERSILAKLSDKVDAISARPINQDIHFHERVYTPADARDRLAEMARLGLEVDR